MADNTGFTSNMSTPIPNVEVLYEESAIIVP
jgi:hypothetical protein